MSHDLLVQMAYYHDFDNEMIPLGVLGGKSGVVTVVKAQDGLEVCCPRSLPLFEATKSCLNSSYIWDIVRKELLCASTIRRSFVIIIIIVIVIIIML